jgi:hypothetical protein
MKKNCPSRLPPKQKQRRIGLPGFPWRINEEQLVYQTSPGKTMKKNWFTGTTVKGK